jgi:hypothetical protein
MFKTPWNADAVKWIFERDLQVATAFEMPAMARFLTRQ